MSPPNEDAVAWIDRWPVWPNPYLLLVGPKGSGKSHLAHVWASKSNAVFIQAKDLGHLDINALNEISKNNVILEALAAGVNEEVIFHLYNLIKEHKTSLLMTSRDNVSDWAVQLPDLVSRLGAIQIAKIQQPDDQLFAAILLKLFSDRQIQITPEIIQYLVTRLERSFNQALNIVKSLDDLSLTEKRRITIPLIKRVLDTNDVLK